MSPLTLYVGAGVLALLALIALRGKRWAYLAFVLLGLLYFPAQTHFRVHAPKCEQILPTPLLLAIWSRLRRNPAYVRLVRRRPAAAPPPAAPPSRAFVPPRGVVPPPPPPPPARGLPGLYVPPRPPPDFSPGPSPVTPSADTAPTHEVAPREGKTIAARRAVVQRLQRILGRLREMLQRLWVTLRGRRPPIVVRR